MSRFGSLGTQYFDDSGQPLSGGSIQFYESGSSTEKDTYSDADQTILNAQPVPLDASGRQPDIFFSGSAKAVLLDSNSAQVEEIDPVGATVSRDAFADWNGLLTYDAEDIVQGSDGEYYLSITSNNVNNDPTSTSGSWMELRFVALWDSAYTYAAGALVIGSNNALYRCINGSSLNDDPTSTPAEWSLIGSSGLNNLLEDTTPQLGGNLDVNGFTVDGRDPSVDGTKLDGIESGATADQTGAEIKSLYEAESNTNAFTDAEQTKLAGIETAATADQAWGDITGTLSSQTDLQSALDDKSDVDPGGGSVTTATNAGAVNYAYNQTTVSPTRGDCGFHVYQQWNADLVLTLTDASWERGDIVRISNVQGSSDITVNATFILLPDGSNDTAVTFNQTVGGFTLMKYVATAGYWMVLP